MNSARHTPKRRSQWKVSEKDGSYTEELMLCGGSVQQAGHTFDQSFTRVIQSLWEGWVLHGRADAVLGTGGTGLTEEPEAMLRARSSVLGTRIAVPSPISSAPATFQAELTPCIKRENTTRNMRSTSAPQVRPAGSPTLQATDDTASHDQIKESVKRSRRVSVTPPPAAAGRIPIEQKTNGVDVKLDGVVAGVDSTTNVRARFPERLEKTPGSKTTPRPASSWSSSRAAFVVLSRPTSSRTRENDPLSLSPPWEESNRASESCERVRFDDEGKCWHASVRGATGRQKRPSMSKGQAGRATLETACHSVFSRGAGPATQRAPVRGRTSAAGEAAAIEPDTLTRARDGGDVGGDEARRTVATVDKIYMSRADRAAEISKENARLRREVEALRAQAAASRFEADAVRRCLEKLEGYVEGVPHEKTEGQRGDNNKRSSQISRLSILEHRKELEKTVVVRRLREQVSQLSEKLAARDEELLLLKRSCRFTALAEMSVAGEEYIKEVERLKAKLNKNGEVLDSLLIVRNGSSKAYGSRAVNIPVVAKPRHATLSTADAATTPEVFSGKESAGQHFWDGNRSDLYPPRTRSDDQRLPKSHQIVHDCDKYRASSAPSRRPPTRVAQQKQIESVTLYGGAQSDREPIQPSGELHACRGDVGTRSKNIPGNRHSQGGRRVGGAAGARARAGLLGPRSLGVRQEGLVIDRPKRGKATPSASRGGEGEGEGRKELSPEMEIDVMKGLVLAQQQRIERQRKKMLELERDLRDYKTEVLPGGEWPQETSSLTAPRLSRLPATSNSTLRPSRSLPEKLDLAGERGVAITPSVTSRDGCKSDRDPVSSKPLSLHSKQRVVQWAGLCQSCTEQEQSDELKSTRRSSAFDGRLSSSAEGATSGAGTRKQWRSPSGCADTFVSGCLSSRQARSLGGSPPQHASEQQNTPPREGETGGLKVEEDALPGSRVPAIGSKTGHARNFSAGTRLGTTRSTRMRLTANPRQRSLDHCKHGQHVAAVNCGIACESNIAGSKPSVALGAAANAFANSV